ncbi:hypothetical protein QVD17_34923 [Tagetes erecta]|uniref:Transcriptional coactivator Hfi1/Transcriptional adapter 1 n=1 Tax=Tagetes erecta TaxID=13708 RepID=A0AAD8K4X2_TARER|nr:hypothetical protein QVD17_34923 [Tagetes erecta]
MQPPQQHSWINLSELKTQIIRKLGPERSKQYFDYLNKFLSLKLSKVEFDKLCLRTIGRDGILLHNQLIRSILRNAVGNKKPLDGVNHQNGPGSIVTHDSSQLGLSNGDILLTSPRKARTAGQRRGGDRKSSIALNGKTNYPSPSSSTPHSDDFNSPLDNGNTSSLNTQKPMQHHQELMQQVQNADGRAKSLGQKEGKDVSGKISLHAPLGIPYYPVSIGGARRAPPIKSGGVSDATSLLDTTTLRARMEPISIAQGLQGVSPDSANVLNNGLDAYLKGLIRSCSELKRPIKSNPTHFRPVNGVTPGHHHQMQEHQPKHSISLLDFRVTMELNPQQLGEDWPELLEKICTHAFEE